jgi:hypothetical protein
MENLWATFVDNIEIVLALATAFLVWLQLRTQSRMKTQDIVLRDKDAELQRIQAKSNAEMERLESQQIKIQSEAEQGRAMNANMEKLINGIFAANQQWQQVVNTQSERRHEDSERLASALDKVSTSNSDLADVLEIQAGQLGNLVTVVQDVGKLATDKLAAMEGLAQNNRTDITSALGISVTYQNKIDQIYDMTQTATNRVQQLATHLEKRVGDMTHTGGTEKRQIIEYLETLKKEVGELQVLIHERLPEPPPPPPGKVLPLPENKSETDELEQKAG